jgi:hypothetical protein
MKQLFLFASVLLLISCNSGKKDNAGTETKTDGMVTELPVDTVLPPHDVPTGKIDIESFGDIKLGQRYSDILKTLGEPDTKSMAQEWGADGLMHEDWTWKNKGLVLNLSSEKSSAEATRAVFSITANAPCTFKTRAGMGIGSTAAEVQEAYKRDINPEESSKEQITVGSVYGGIIFTLKNDKVASIFLGAAAE